MTDALYLLLLLDIYDNNYVCVLLHYSHTVNVTYIL